MLNDYLTMIPKGEVRTLFYSNRNQIRSALDQAYSSDPDNWRLVGKEWDVLPSHHQILGDILESFSKAVAGLWPEWYGESLTMDGTSSNLEHRLVIDQRIAQLKIHHPTIVIPWLEAAVDACLNGQLPIFSDRYSDQIQLIQLSHALESDNLVLLLFVEDQNPSDIQLHSLSQLAIWCASLTNGRVAVLLWHGLVNRSAIDSINYQPLTFATARLPLPTSAGEETKLAIWPIKGKPHPHSPGEQLLHEKILSDQELKGLFRFNQRVVSNRGRRFLVDLLWGAGKVVVEIDGYRYHNNQYAFIEDRHRDYELLISGYIVLRLTHDEVLSDVEIATEKIRDVIRFRWTQNPIIKENC
jgi:very-short-patch-repair endonuclease